MWSFTLEGYLGFGGGFTIGQNEADGRGFMSIRAGKGLGLVGAWDPKANRIGYIPCDDSYGVGLGVYGNAGYGLGTVNAGVSGSLGMNLLDGSVYHGVSGPHFGLVTGGASAGVGVELQLW